MQSAYNRIYKKCGHGASAFTKAVDKFLIFALQMPRNSYLCKEASVEHGLEPHYW